MALRRELYKGPAVVVVVVVVIILGLTLLLYNGRTTTYDAMYIAAAALVTTTVPNYQIIKISPCFFHGHTVLVALENLGTSCGTHCKSQKLLLWVYTECSTMSVWEFHEYLTSFGCGIHRISYCCYRYKSYYTNTYKK